MSKADLFIENLLKWKGTPFRLGMHPPQKGVGTDCSKYILWELCKTLNLPIPQVPIYGEGDNLIDLVEDTLKRLNLPFRTLPPYTPLKKGDVLILKLFGTPHLSVYIGNGEIIYMGREKVKKGKLPPKIESIVYKVIRILALEEN